MDSWKASTRPLISLLFVTPILIGYEVGVLLQGRHAWRNGADVWLRRLLDAVGFGQYLLLPLLTCGLLLAWHHLRHEPWRVNWSVFAGMALESVVFGLLLLAVARLQGRMFAAVESPLAFEWLKRLVGYLGAGLYEELLFRLLLLSGAVLLFRTLGMGERSGLIWAIVATSLLFSLAHYKLPLLGLKAGDNFAVSSFVFRFLAGVYFAVLYWQRGFGIAAMTHTLYDVFTEI